MASRNTTKDAIQARSVVPDAVIGNVAVAGDDGGALRQLTLTLTDVPLSITDALAYGSVKLLTLPAGYVNVLGCTVPKLTFKTTSAIATTLNAAAVLQWGLGTAAASAITLATTMINITPGTGTTPGAAVASSTINVGVDATPNALAAATLLNGSTTALAIFLNVGVTTATEIDGDATLTVSGTVVLTAVHLGDI